MTPATLLPELSKLKLSSASSLPPEVLFCIFKHLNDPRDLARACFVDKAWRSVATDGRLWEPHFWTFYRPIYASDKDDQPELQQYRVSKRRAAMLNWLSQASNSPPTCVLFSAYSDEVWKAIDDIRTITDTPPGPEDAESTKKAFGGAISSACRQLDKAREVPPPVISAAGFATPAFLLETAGRAKAAMPDFHRLFFTRMNADDEILQRLQRHVTLTAGTLADLLDLIAEHRQGSRPLFAALCATQPITSDNVACFLPSGGLDEDASPWPRALEVHRWAAQGKTLPQSAHCLMLHHTALKALGHLQRFEAIYSIRSMHERKEEFEPDAFSSFRDRVEACCRGVEEGMTNVALFRAGEAIAIREYLDLLALFIASDLDAEDRAASVKGQFYGVQADARASPQGSTRHRLARIISSLGILGFGIATSQDASDIDNAFINVVMYCPGQRLASPLTFAAIICAIARRLGIAATIANATTRTLIVAVEDAEEPAGWPPSEWSRFFVDMSEKPEICEADNVGARLGSSSYETHGDALLRPASPLAVLERVANAIKQSTEAQRQSVTRYYRRGRYAQEDEILGEAGSAYQLGKLRLYLEGREATPPAPLLPALWTSSLASLPPTAVHAMRNDPARLAQDAVYCAKWITKLVSPQQLGGLDRANKTLAHMIAHTTSHIYACDYNILIRCEGKPKDEEFARDSAVEAGTEVSDSSDEEDSSDEGQTPRPAKWFRIVVDLGMGDHQPGHGLGCAGGGDPSPREDASGMDLPRYLVDRAHPNNAQVKYGVGTVFEHSIHGWKGVIVGWDTECRMCDHWIEHWGIVSNQHYDGDVEAVANPLHCPHALLVSRTSFQREDVTSHSTKSSTRAT